MDDMFSFGVHCIFFSYKSENTHKPSNKQRHWENVQTQQGNVVTEERFNQHLPDKIFNFKRSRIPFVAFYLFFSFLITTKICLFFERMLLLVKGSIYLSIRPSIHPSKTSFHSDSTETWWPIMGHPLYNPGNPHEDTLRETVPWQSPHWSSWFWGLTPCGKPSQAGRWAPSSWNTTSLTLLLFIWNGNHRPSLPPQRYCLNCLYGVPKDYQPGHPDNIQSHEGFRANLIYPQGTATAELLTCLSDHHGTSVGGI